MNDLQKVQLDILKTFADIADAKGLKWFLMFGSLLGALRHKGFIPWDDDVDIVMPREDYDKLRLSNNWFKEPYFLQTTFTDPANSPRFIRLRHSDTAFIKEYPSPYTKGGNLGIYIDIIPLDTVPDKASAVNLQEGAQNIHSQMYSSAALDENKNQALPEFKERFCLGSGGIEGYYDFFAQRYEKFCKVYREGKYYSMPVLKGECGNRVYDKLWFKESLVMDFEWLKLPVPIGHQEVLVTSYPDGLYEPEEKFRELKCSEDWIVDANKSYKEYTKRYTDMLKDIEGKEIYIFGAGDSLRIWLERYSKGLNVVCAFDNSPAKWGKEAYGIVVKNPEELKIVLNENSRLIIASMYHREIGKQLEEMGVGDWFAFVDGLDYKR